MQLKILCPQWGLEHLQVEDFFSKVKNAGYDGTNLENNEPVRSQWEINGYMKDLLRETISQRIWIE
ncbi:MAG: hypothetical protein ABI297_04030 [Ginsengibacter sp.]